MPTYDYKCPVCGYEIEKKHSIKEVPYYVCPKCSSEEDVRLQPKISSRTPVHFKGKGFYETDYKNK